MSEISISLKGLNCPNCAGKIERFVNKLPGVSEASLNLMNQEIFIYYTDIDKDELVAKVRKVTNDLEPHVVVEEKVKRSSGAREKQVSVHNDRDHSHSEHTHTHGEDCGHDHSHGEHVHEETLELDSSIPASKIVIALKGLNCPNCAGKIEKLVNRMNGVEEAGLNLINQEIVISYIGIDRNELIAKVRKITNDLEPHVVVEEKVRRQVSGRSQAGHSQAVSKAHAAHSYAGYAVSHEEHIHGEDCAHDHSHGELAHESHEAKAAEQSEAGKTGLNREMTIRLVKYGVGFVFFVLALMDIFPPVTMALFLASYALFGTTVLLKAFNNIIRGEIFDENFLMCISTVGAFAIGEYPEAVAVMVFYQIGEFFQDLAVDRSRDSIKNLMNLKADYANLEENGQIIQVDPLDISVGDIIVVKPGEKVPLDGIVLEGKSQMDMSSLIGESMPRSINAEDSVLSGALNLTGILRIEVTKDYDNSTVAKILDMVENASNKKAPTEKFITKFSRIYTPAVCMAALALAIVPTLLIPGANFSDWLYRGLVFLVVSCPCALVISVPLSFFSGIGYSSKKGILVKGTTFIEALNKVNTVVFDKTGTLTRGVFTVTGIFAQNGESEAEILETAYILEKNSNHPIAKSIVKEYSRRELSGGGDVSDFEEISGQGLKGKANGEYILAGNSRLMENNGVETADYSGFGTVVHLSRGNKYLGYIEISDIVKEDSAEAIRELNARGIRKIAMVSGDKKETAEKIAKSLGIDEVFAELLPHEKINAIEQLYADDTDAVIAFAGDGINDAPVLARVDVGIAMGGVGSDAAIEAADIVIMTDEPSKISNAIDTSRKTMQIVKQNIAFALIIKFGVLGLSVFGMASMWLAVFADVGVALIAVINAMRAK